MQICICDDDKTAREKIRSVCAQFFAQREMECMICEADCADAAFRQIGGVELLILDIEMPGMNGLALKDKLQRIDAQVFILFVTDYEEMVYDAFGMRVLGFVSKKHFTERFGKYLELAVSVLGEDIMIDKKYHSRDVAAIHAEREYCRIYFALEEKKEAMVRISLKKNERTAAGG